METRHFELAELRAIDDANPRRLRGLAVVYGATANLGKFQERVSPGALTRTLANAHDIKARFEHRDLIASRSNGTLKLQDTPQGLAVDIDVAETRAGDDMLALVRRGDIKGMSFAFLPAKNGQRFTRDNGQLVRELLDIDLFEVTVTDRPAYPDTAVALRSIDRATMEEIDRLATMPQPDLTLTTRRMQLRRLAAAI